MSIVVVKFGVIGLGNRGSKFALHSIIPHPDLELVAISDQNESKFLPFEEQDVVSYTNYDDLLKNREVDAVFIATPDDTHAEVVLKAVRAEKHILCEKPLEVSLSKISEMEAALAHYKGVFLVGYVLRYAPLYHKVKQILDAGTIGQIWLANGVDHIHYGGYAFFHDWHREKKRSGSLLLQKATHSLDILNWLIDSKPVQVAGLGGLEVFGEKGAKKKFGAPLEKNLHCRSCTLKWSCEESLLNIKKYKNIEWQKNWPDNCVFDSDVDVDDHQALLILYQNNTKLTYSLCQFSAFYRREFQFFGTKGELYFDDERNEIIINDRLKPEKTVIHVAEQAHHGGGDDEMLLDFLTCLKEKKTPLSNLASSAVASRLVLAAEDAISQNKIIEVEG
ncbi:Gfo/Idh/MocA family protein [Listeria fleischmannii]|uniref:Gfo/Idh/MocA family protein n=1 Tax=Listeria fleischmannii TaxID=1069827 RepID=UPI001CB75CBF|nr:Gfo/Idh/MocA family oxidoreductase [Listeria fleischmannii]